MFQFELNGRAVRVPGARAGGTLLDFLRSEGLTGAKEGCAEGECGACAVAVRCSAGETSEYRVVNSCLMLLPMAANREVFSVEALADGGVLNPVQRALADAGGSQCGYCTPGFVMSLFAEYYRPGRRGPCDPRAMEGNLCRCTGYRPIADAARTLGPALADRFSERLGQPAPPLQDVELSGFSRPATLEACVTLLRTDATTTLVGGGTDLLVEYNLHRRRWPHLVSLEGIDELRGFREEPDVIRIGAALPLTEVAQRWELAPAAVQEWLTLFASPLIRNRATLGGNLATASPIGDSAPLLLALDAAVEVVGTTDAGRSGAVSLSRRTIPLSEFFTGYRTTALRRGELIAAVRIPKPLPGAVRFYKIAKRRLDDISTVAAGFSIDLHDGLVRQARFALGGVAATPLRVTEAEAAVDGRAWTLAAVERVQAVFDRVLAPLSDHRGSRAYRREVACSLVERFWRETQP